MILDQKSSSLSLALPCETKWSRDGATDNQSFTIYFVGDFLFVARFLMILYW